MQSDEELISLPVKDVVENLVNKVVSARAKSEGASKVASKLKQSTPMTTGQIKNVSQNRLV